MSTEKAILAGGCFWELKNFSGSSPVLFQQWLATPAAILEIQPSAVTVSMNSKVNVGLR
jgi:hypothetical protein